MSTTRRELLRWSAATSLLSVGFSAPAWSTSLDGASQDRGTPPGDLLRAVKSAMDDELLASGAPGMSLGLLGPNGWSATLEAGFADVGTRAPVTARHRFEIGSISKSFVGLAIYILVERGALDLHTDLRRLMPELRWPEAAITIEHLLNHTSGLPTNAPLFPEPTGGKLWSGFTPGTRFSYCNTGFNILAFVIERVTGQNYPAALRTLVLDRLQMADSAAAIVTADRLHYPTAYIPFAENRPYFVGAPLAPAPWLEYDGGAGSIGATAADMVRYLAFLSRAVSGDASPLLGPEFGRRWITPVTAAHQFGADASYANGLLIEGSEQAKSLSHTGGTYSFSSAIMHDIESGIGCFASVNFGRTPYRPKALVKHVVDLAKASFASRPLPDRLRPVAQTVGSKLVGRYVSDRLGSFEISLAPSGPVMDAGGTSGRLADMSATEFWADHPLFADHFLSEGPQPGQLWWGGHLVGRMPGVKAPPPSPDLTRYVGRYRNNDPWWDPISIVVRGDKLIMEGLGELVRQDDGSWRLKDSAFAMERIWFDGRVNDHMSRLSFSGIDFLRNTAYAA